MPAERGLSLCWCTRRASMISLALRSALSYAWLTSRSHLWSERNLCAGCLRRCRFELRLHSCMSHCSRRWSRVSCCSRCCPHSVGHCCDFGFLSSSHLDCWFCYCVERRSLGLSRLARSVLVCLNPASELVFLTAYERF